MNRTQRSIIATLRGTAADRERLTDDARSVGLSVNQYVRFMLRLDDPNADDAEDGTGEYWKLRRQLRAARAANQAAVETAALAAGELLGIDLRLGTNRLHLEYVRKMLRRFAEANGAPPEPEQPEPPTEDAPSDAVGPSDTYARFRGWIVEILGLLPISEAMAAIEAARGRSHDAVDPAAVAALAGAIDAAHAEMMRRDWSSVRAATFVDAWITSFEYEVAAARDRGAKTYLDFLARL